MNNAAWRELDVPNDDLEWRLESGPEFGVSR
jgi:hypothetical protein